MGKFKLVNLLGGGLMLVQGLSQFGAGRFWWGIGFCLIGIGVVLSEPVTDHISPRNKVALALLNIVLLIALVGLVAHFI